MFDKLDEVVKRFEELTEKLADPSIYDRQKEFKQVSEERGNIEDLVNCYQIYRKIKGDLDGAKEILAEEKDEEMRDMAKEEISEYEGQIPGLEEELRLLLLPKDPLDSKNCMVELRAGAGGDESSIFVGDIWSNYHYFIIIFVVMIIKIRCFKEDFLKMFWVTNCFIAIVF